MEATQKTRARIEDGRRTRPFGLRISDEVYVRFREISWDEGRPMGRIVGDLIEDYVREHDARNGGETRA